jgi:hypothetical protein
MSQHPAEDLLVRARRGELADDDARRFELGHHVRQRLRVADLRVAVVADHLVTGTAHPLAHVETHLAEADESELHGVLPYVLLVPGKGFLSREGERA